MTFLFLFLLNLEIYMQQVTLLLRRTGGLNLPAYLTIKGEDKSQLDNNLGMWQECRQWQRQSWLGWERLFLVSISCFILLSNTNKLLPSPSQTLATIPTFSTSTHHHHCPLSFKKNYLTMDDGLPASTGFFYFLFHSIWPLHDYACPLCGDFIYFNDSAGPPLGEDYF